MRFISSSGKYYIVMHYMKNHVHKLQFKFCNNDNVHMKKKRGFFLLLHKRWHTLLVHLSQRPIGEPIVYPCSGVRRCSSSKISNISETAWPIIADICVEPLWGVGTIVCINGPGHMTKMAAMPIQYI